MQERLWRKAAGGRLAKGMGHGAGPGADGRQAHAPQAAQVQARGGQCAVAGHDGQCLNACE
eukprot:3444928-Pyramimonas_sp.AAC.1